MNEQPTTGTTTPEEAAKLLFEQVKNLTLRLNTVEKAVKDHTAIGGGHEW